MLPRALLWPFSDHVTKHRPGVLGSKGLSAAAAALLFRPCSRPLPVQMATLTPKVSMGLFSAPPPRASHATQDFLRVRAWLSAWGLRPGLQWGCLCPRTELAEEGVLGQGSGESSKESQFDPSLPNCYEDMFIRIAGDTYFI